jgi:hypothetical protein
MLERALTTRDHVLPGAGLDSHSFSLLENTARPYDETVDQGSLEARRPHQHSTSPVVKRQWKNVAGVNKTRSPGG